MPEIVEVAKFASQLNHEYGGHTLLDVEAVGGRFLKPSHSNIREDMEWLARPLSNVSMQSKGKFLYWTMTDAHEKRLSFHISLAMSGSFGQQQKHSAIHFSFDNRDVFFNDPRHFGTFRISYGDRELNDKLNRLGWNPLCEPSIPLDTLDKFRKHPNKPIGELLMEQGTIACGCGNYLRAECLFLAQISPFRLVSSLSDQELLLVCQSLIDTIQQAYQAGGATISTYSDLYGIAGEFYQQFRVYGRKTDPNGNPVQTAKDKNGRTLHFVPAIQH